MLAGLVMAGFLIVEALSLDTKLDSDVLPMVLGMQLLYFVPGVLTFALAGYLWTREYRNRRSAIQQGRRVMRVTPLVADVRR
jgi:hypothetical protein